MPTKAAAAVAVPSPEGRSFGRMTDSLSPALHVKYYGSFFATHLSATCPHVYWWLLHKMRPFLTKSFREEIIVLKNKIKRKNKYVYQWIDEKGRIMGMSMGRQRCLATGRLQVDDETPPGFTNPVQMKVLLSLRRFHGITSTRKTFFWEKYQQVVWEWSE